MRYHRKLPRHSPKTNNNWFRKPGKMQMSCLGVRLLMAGHPGCLNNTQATNALNETLRRVEPWRSARLATRTRESTHDDQGFNIAIGLAQWEWKN
jgi:hypothetical protein